jgi:hypothetical protein
VKNKSELLLEGYLRGHGYREFEFEPEMVGSTRRPDYLLRAAEAEVLLEVKEFRTDPREQLSSGFFDPYPPVREKIDAARDKFRQLKSHCCCLVLYNVNKPLVLLDWQHVYGAMLGTIGWSVPLDLPGRPAPPDAKTKTIFMSGGKMHRERHGTPVAPQNQTISAILVLGRVAAGEQLLQAELQVLKAQKGRALSFDEMLDAHERALGTTADYRHRPLRVVVHENPYARIPLPQHLFCGPWDERYGERDGLIGQVFVGHEVGKLPPKT